MITLDLLALFISIYRLTTLPMALYTKNHFKIRNSKLKHVAESGRGRFPGIRLEYLR
jgi:hypothetical protein